MTNAIALMERYRFINKIGEGGFGRADLMQDRRTLKYVVVKTIACKGRKEMEEARKEACFLKKLDHASIITYIDSFVDPNKQAFHLVLEYADAKDLKVYIEKNSPVVEGKILEIFSQIMLGLQYLHSKSVRILHRDLKAANVFLFKNDLVKIGDFGISREISHDDPAKTMIGTPYFMSPELLKGHRYGFPSDIWAAGLILYELMTGEHAFNARSRDELYEKIRQGRKPETPRGYSAPLTDLLEKMMSMDPRDRPTADEIVGLPIVQRGLNHVAEKGQKRVGGRLPRQAAGKKKKREQPPGNLEASDIPEWIMNNAEAAEALKKQAMEQEQNDIRRVLDAVRMSVVKMPGSGMASMGIVQSDLTNRREALEADAKARMGEEKYALARSFVKEHFADDRDTLPYILGVDSVPEEELQLLDAITMIERYERGDEMANQ